MTTPTWPGQGPAPEPEPGPVGLLARLFLSQLLVVLAVAAVIATVFALAGSDGTTPDGVAGQPETSSPAAGGSATPAPSEPAAPPTESAPPAPVTPAPSTSAPTPAKQPKVDVLNQSAGGDAGRAVADRLRGRGWRIGRVADFNGTVQTTTVYYPPRLRPEARRLARDLPGSPRLLERFSSLSANRLSVVLVD